MSGVVAVQVCTAWTSTPEGFMACRELAWQQAYLIPPEAAGYVDILVNVVSPRKPSASVPLASWDRS
ncbi:Uncharacterised protein [Pseudomonas aeruginosa]|nr:Uncharacterised protein [Pseudomonas aeruginosa]